MEHEVEQIERYIRLTDDSVGDRLQKDTNQKQDRVM